MYHSRGSFNNSNHRYNHSRQRSSSGFSRRKITSFDPSRLIKTSSIDSMKPEYEITNQFSNLAICNQLKQNISARGYKNLTPIQDQIIPLILKGQDVIGLANTGTGKTAAFLIPLINNLYQQRTGRVLVIAPTRELAVQIEAEFKSFAQGINLYSSLCIGGASMHYQITALKRKPNFVVGTPGRLIDLEKRKVLDFRTFNTIVLDEVDQMLDMGFINDMKYVISILPKTRHSLFFSATLPSKLDSIVNDFLNNPIKIQTESQKTAANIDQDIVKINGRSKVDLLQNLLKQEGFDRVLVFGRTKHGLDKLARILFERGFRVAAIHGNKSQGQRQKSLKQFKDNYVQVLLATDIASRGLDINDVTHVINYDLPQSYEAYIHRIGRTGRANKTGKALSFVE